MMKRLTMNFVVATFVCAATVQAAITIDLVNPVAGSGPFFNGASVGFDGWWKRTQDNDPIPDVVHAGFYDDDAGEFVSYGSDAIDDSRKNIQHNWATTVNAVPNGTWQMRAHLIRLSMFPGGPPAIVATDNNGNAQIVDP